MAYPTNLSNYTGSETLSAAGHSTEHNALEAKLGIGASTPVASTVLRGTATGTTAYAQVVLTTDVTGTLPVANGGTGGATAGAARTALGLVIGTNVQAWDADLDTLAGKTIPSGATLADTSSSQTFTNKTLTTPIIASISNTGTVTLPTATDTLIGKATTDTLTNKRITARVGTTADAATITPVGDSNDMYTVTALGQAATIAAPSGTPTDGQKLIIRLLDNGTARALTWNAIYVVIGVTLPTTTVLSKYTYVGCVYNSVSNKWDVLAVNTQA